MHNGALACFHPIGLVVCLPRWPSVLGRPVWQAWKQQTTSLSPDSLHLLFPPVLKHHLLLSGTAITPYFGVGTFKRANEPFPVKRLPWCRSALDLHRLGMCTYTHRQNSVHVWRSVGSVTHVLPNCMVTVLLDPLLDVKAFPSQLLSSSSLLHASASECCGKEAGWS